MKRKSLKAVAIFVILNLFFELSFPIVASALTGGPSQPEVQSFEPVGTSQMVDISSGDFNYNIPLLDVDGYPVNISYHSGITMDQEASWVGLGWNINPGVINRNVRGIPDDFDGQKIKKEFNSKDNETYGVDIGIGFELFGSETFSGSLSASLGVFFNNYKGVGLQWAVDPAISFAITSKLKGNLSLGISGNSQSGLGFDPSLGFELATKKQNERGNGFDAGFSVSAPYNSRSGLKSINLGVNASVTSAKVDGSSTTGYKEAGALGFNGGSAINFGTQTYIPELNMPTSNYNLSLMGKIGPAIVGSLPYGTIKGYYSLQHLDKQRTENSAYGYLYQQDATNEHDDMLDFNREKDAAFTTAATNLGLTNPTYDVYSLSGQGIGGMYRPYRGDIGILHDNYMLNQTRSGSIGVEFGIGDEFHFGANVNVNYAISQSQKWVDPNLANLNFQKADYSKTPLYEAAYFKNAGEKTPSDTDFYNKIGAEKAMRISLDTMETSRTGGGFIYQKGNEKTGNNLAIKQGNNGYYRRAKRDKRNQEIVPLTGDKAKTFGVSKHISNYAKNAKMNAAGVISSATIDYTSGYRQGTSLAEISAYNTDGSRYVYGLPAYNTKQVEQSFSVGGRYVSLNDFGYGYTSYDTTIDNTIRNKKGIDNYFNSVTTPSYAHSYLLTSLLSSDYVDLTGDGPSDDDLGNYTKFNYTLVNSKYHWRAPYMEALVNHDNGHISDPMDDKANFVYGEKEVWLLNSIVTKNYIAEFEIKGRRDGFGVHGINGGIGKLDSSYYLNKIILYAKKDRMLYGANAVPIKTIHFVYNYSLCNGVENNIDNYTGTDSLDLDSTKNNGKLTLKEIYFTYGSSNKGEYSPYQFEYNQDSTYFSSKPARYNLKSNDRWGTFKPNDHGYSYLSTHLNNMEFPYTDQDNRSGKADKYASAWNLVQIILPSTGTINITYESDDYAYVQNRTAMQMFKILGFSPNSTYSNRTSYLYSTGAENNYVFFKLSSPLTGSTALQQLHDRYITQAMDQGVDGSNVYFNCKVNLDGSGNYEYVRGYAQIDVNGANTSYGLTNDTIAWLKFNTVDIGDKGASQQVSPVCRTAWQLARLEFSKLIYPDMSSGRPPEEGIKSLMATLMDANVLFNGFNHALRSRNFASDVYLPQCWIRLKNPSKCKLGGGARVKQITNNDSWSTIGTGNSGAADFSYGKQYSYTTTEKQSDGTTLTISSGVATYEPTIGNEENSWHQPVSYSDDNKMFPDNTFYTDAPFGESFFPSPTVTYSKVTESNLAHANVNRTATGYSVHEFFTSKDYPTIINYTDLKTANTKSQGLFSLLGFGVEDFESASQGYAIELNDMNGKPKAEIVYPQNAVDENAFKSKVEYFYNNDTAYNHNVAGQPKRLNNKVDVIYPNDTLAQNTVGMDIDATVDMRVDSTFTFSAGLQFNTDGFFLPPFIQAVIPIILPSYSSELTRFNETVVTKVIRKYGILQKTIASEDGAQISTENLAFDSETGEVLLTKTQNEFEDPIYNFTYPAHWAYDGMGPAYKNSLAHVDNVFVTTDSIQLPNSLKPKDYFVAGDYINISHGTDHIMFAHVQNYLGHLFLIDLKGRRINLGTTTSYTLEIALSGRRNMQSMPIGTITSLVNPIQTSGSTRFLSFSSSTKIINAGSAEFSQSWPGQFNYIKSQRCDPGDIVIDIMALLNYYGAHHSSFVKGGHDNLSGKGFYDSSRILKTILSGAGFTSNGLMDTFPFSQHIDYEWNYSGSSHFGITLIDSVNFYLRDAVSFSAPTASSNSPLFSVIVTLSNGKKVKAMVEYEGPSEPWFNCNTFCYTAPTTLVDPYQVGLTGLWRKKKDWVYLDNRTYSSPLNTRTDGAYASFSPFWQYNGKNLSVANPNSNWTWSKQITNYAKSGTEIENVDPLSRYSAAIYGYNGTMPIAVANNTKYRDIAYDGFEDYKNFQNSCTQINHWDFLPITGYTLDSVIKHTGKRSLKLSSGGSASSKRQIFDCGGLTLIPPYADFSLTYVKPCDCIGLFSPEPGKYIISGWVRMDTSRYATHYGGANIGVDITGATHVSKTFVANGPIVEGWQQIDSTFTVPAGDTSITVSLNAASGNATWFDDVRIYPFNSNIKTYAYDERSLKLLGELDENNYATIYEYDEQGNLIRVKKETINGIMTINESRTSIIKRQP